MNDSMSILLATTILAVGGLGLYMYKSSDDDKQRGDEDEYNEESIFGGNFWGSSDDKNDNENDNENLDEDLEEHYKPRRKNAKTHRNRKSSGTSRRKY